MAIVRRPKTTEQASQDNLRHAFDMINIASGMDNFQAAPDEEFDYLKKAEELAYKTTRARLEAGLQRERNTHNMIGSLVPEGGINFRKLRKNLNQIDISPAPVARPQGGRNRRPVRNNNNGQGRDVHRFIKAIAGQESGGNYGAVNPDSGAAGKYQIMPANFAGSGGWDEEALGREVGLAQFLSHPRLQERIARHKLKEYFNKYGAAGAASAWYSGSPDNFNSTTGQGAYPSIHDYVMQVLRRAGLTIND